MFPQDTVNWRTYKQGAFSNAKGTLTNVFETEGQFQTYWYQVNGAAAGKIPTGGVDWSKEKLIAINLGPRANPGYEVSVSSIKRVRGQIQVTFQEMLPMQGVNYPQVLVNPWVIVKMDRMAAGAISFKGETVKRSTGVIITPPPKGGGKCCGDVCKCCASCTCDCQAKKGG